MGNPLDGLFGGLRRIFLAGVEKPFHASLNVIAPGATITEGTDVDGQPTIELDLSALSGGGGGTAALDWKDSVRVATTAALAASTRAGAVRTASANGALPSIDAIALVVGDSLLDKNHATQAERGIWVIGSLGSAGTPWVMTRRADFDTTAEITGGLRVAVVQGTANGGKVWKLDTVDPIVLNTTSLVFSADSSTGVVAGNGLTGTSVFSVLADGSTLGVSASGVKVATSGVTPNELAANAVTTAKILDANVTLGKLASLAIVDIAAVDAATTANITISGAQTIDGVTLTTGVSRVLVRKQSAAAENAIYVYNSAGAWTRASDQDGASDFRPGVQFKIIGGTQHAGKLAWLATTGAIVVGATAVAYELSPKPAADPGDNNKVYIASAGDTVVTPLLTLVQTVAAGTAYQGLRVNASATAVEATSNLPTPILTDSTTTRTYALADAGSLVECTHASGSTSTIPTNATVAFPIGSVILTSQTGAAQVSIVAAGGVTLENPESATPLAAASAKTQKLGATIGVIKMATDRWRAFGQLELF